MPRFISLLLVIIIALPARASASPEVGRAMSNPGKLGEVTFRWLGLPLYDAALFTPAGQGFSWARPIALQLTYARSISRDNLIEATITEMERMEGARGDHAAIRQKLVSCFRDVSKGDRFTASASGGNAVQLWFNGRQTCTLGHSNIRERFLGIWLSDKSRSVRLSRQLRGVE